MQKQKIIKIVSRGSTLARVQAEEVGNALRSVHPDLSIEYHTSNAVADIDLNMDITKPENIGVFTRDISNRVIDGDFDIAIHSWKDLPVEPSSGTEIIGTLERGDMRDIMIVKKDTAILKYKKNIKILTSSPRRKYNIKNILPDLLPMEIDSMSFSDIRGNIETRLNKFISGDADIVLMAKVAIDRLMRLGNQNTINAIKEILYRTKWMILPLSIFPTAPGQGAIAIEARKNSLHLKDLIKPINAIGTFEDVKKEKSILSQYGGGCHQKIGVSIWNARHVRMCSLIGETEDGGSLNTMGPLDKKPYDMVKKVSSDDIYPNKSDNNMFVRKRILNEQIKTLKKSFIFISRKNVIDSCGSIHKSNIFWTSGVKTWRYAARKGYWINGSSDSLGEQNGIEIDHLIAWKLKKYKLSHTNASSKIFQILPTYQLEFDEDKIKMLKLDERTDFFWMSPLQYEKAVEFFPEISNGNHSCGFGRTYEYLKTNLPNSKKINCYFSYKHWLDDQKVK